MTTFHLRRTSLLAAAGVTLLACVAGLGLTAASAATPDTGRPVNLRTADLSDVTVPGSTCFSDKPIRLTHGQGAGGRFTDGRPLDESEFGPVVYGDVTGDGQVEAFVRLFCEIAGGGTAASDVKNTIVVFDGSSGSVRALGVLPAEHSSGLDPRPTLLGVPDVEGGIATVREDFYYPSDSDASPTGVGLTRWWFLSGRLQIAAPSGPVGRIDSVSNPNASTVTVRGWVADTAHLATSTHVALYVGSTGRQFPATINRPDVQAYLFAPSANFGFEATMPLSPGAHQVCAYAISLSVKPNQLIGCVLSDTTGEPIGHVDSVTPVCVGQAPATSVRITGWVFDPNRAGGPGELDAYLDPWKQTVPQTARITTTLNRPDVAKVYHLANAKVGFSFVMSTQHGFDDIRLYALNLAGAGHNELIDTVPALLTSTC